MQLDVNLEFDPNARFKGALPVPVHSFFQLLLPSSDLDYSLGCGCVITLLSAVV
jgi:hypothetical protein